MLSYLAVFLLGVVVPSAAVGGFLLGWRSGRARGEATTRGMVAPRVPLPPGREVTWAEAQRRQALWLGEITPHRDALWQICQREKLPLLVLMPLKEGRVATVECHVERSPLLTRLFSWGRGWCRSYALPGTLLALTFDNTPMEWSVGLAEAVWNSLET